MLSSTHWLCSEKTLKHIQSTHTESCCHIILGLCVKGNLSCKIHFYMLFGHKCVLAVCVHNHPIMIKIHPLIFLIPINDKQCLKASRLQNLHNYIHCRISRDPALSKPHTIRYVYLTWCIQVRNYFLLKLSKLFSSEQYVIFCFYFIVWVILTVQTAV